MTPEIPTVLTAKEVAKILQVSAWTVYEKAKTGEFPSVRIGRSVRFVLGDVLAAMKRKSA